MQQLYRTLGKRNSVLGGHTQGLMFTRTQGESSDFVGSQGETFGGSPGEEGGGCGSELIKASDGNTRECSSTCVPAGSRHLA